MLENAVCDTITVCEDHSPWWNVSLTAPGLFLSPDNLQAAPPPRPNITSDATLYLIWVTQAGSLCHTHTRTSPFVIITNSPGIPDYDQPILLGVTDRFRTWKAMIGHSWCGGKRIRDQHCRVSGIRQMLCACVCAATVYAANLLIIQRMQPCNCPGRVGEKGVEEMRWGREAKRWDFFDFDIQSFLSLV